jgi:hypothetical protein
VLRVSRLGRVLQQQFVDFVDPDAALPEAEALHIAGDHQALAGEAAPLKTRLKGREEWVIYK